MVLDLESKELMNCVQGLWIGGLDKDSTTVRSLFKGVTYLPLQVLHHRDAIWIFVMHSQGVREITGGKGVGDAS